MKKKDDGYERPSVTVDIVLFTIRDDKLQILLVKRKIEPFKNQWAIPGGFVRMEESLHAAAKRELEEETGVADIYLEQLYTFGDPDRDPRERVITVSYFALINSNSQNIKLHADTDASDVRFFPVKDMPQLAFDHKKIVEYAMKRLIWKFDYTTVAFSLLDKKFAISELQKIYEIVYDKQFDKRNFRKKILSLDILEEQEVKRNVSHRPPQLYSLKKDIGEIVEIL